MTLLLVFSVAVVSTILAVYGLVVSIRAVQAPSSGPAGPRQARRIVFGIGLALAAITSACFVAGMAYDMPTLVQASLVIGLEEAWEWTMLTGLLKRAERVELEAFA